MVSVDRLAGKPTVKMDTLQTLAQATGKPTRYRMLDPQTLVNLYVRGYWITRHMAETRLPVLQDLLKQRMSRRNLEERIASAFGVESAGFWETINLQVVNYFASKLAI